MRSISTLPRRRYNADRPRLRNHPTVASVFDGQTLRLIPLDPSDATPEVLRSVLLVGRDGELMVGRAAIDHYTASNVGRPVDYAEVYVGTIEMTFAGVGTIIKDA